MTKYIEQKVADLEKRVAELERKDAPWVKPDYMRPRQGIPDDVIDALKRCTKCGLELRPVMGYVCSQPNCPTGLGSPMCNV